MTEEVFWDVVVDVCRESVADLYVEAEQVGLEIFHSASAPVFEYSALPMSDGAQGRFRTVGSLIWLKDERRWCVYARCNCSATELASLIAFGIGVVGTHGHYPRYWTRNRIFKHYLNDNGKPRARARVVIPVDDNGASESAEATLSIPDDISSLLDLSSQNETEVAR